MKKIAVNCIVLFSICAASIAHAQDVSKELRNVRAYFDGSNGTLLTTTQALMGIQPDGKWGPNTATTFKGTLEDYIAIGGRGSHWGVNSKKDTERFIRWIAAAKFANETGGEYPD